MARPLYVNALKFGSRHKWASGRGWARVVAAAVEAAAFYYMHNFARGSSLVRLGPLGPWAGEPRNFVPHSWIIHIYSQLRLHQRPAARLLFIRLHRLGHESAKLMPSKLMVQFEWLVGILISAATAATHAAMSCSVILRRLASPRKDCKIFQLILASSTSSTRRLHLTN